jgi:hypothetical protein
MIPQKGTHSIHITGEEIDRIILEELWRWRFGIEAYFFWVPYRIVLCAHDVRLAKVNESILGSTWTEISWQRVEDARAVVFEHVYDHIQIMDVLFQ